MTGRISLFRFQYNHLPLRESLSLTLSTTPLSLSVSLCLSPSISLSLSLSIYIYIRQWNIEKIIWNNFDHPTEFLKFNLILSIFCSKPFSTISDHLQEVIFL